MSSGLGGGQFAGGRAFQRVPAGWKAGLQPRLAAHKAPGHPQWEPAWRSHRIEKPGLRRLGKWRESGSHLMAMVGFSGLIPPKETCTVGPVCASKGMTKLICTAPATKPGA